MCHAVLAVVSNCCPPLKGRFLTRYSPVRHCPLFQLDESSFHRFSFDLHVLSTPPAFVLSQDQTLYKSYLNGHSRLNLYRAICHSFKNFLYLPSRVIDLTPFRQVSQLRSGLFSQPLALPSGAFRFVRCLIYKVHVPQPRNSHYFTTCLPSCQLLFCLFQTFFVDRILLMCAALSDGFVRLPRLEAFVNG